MAGEPLLFIPDVNCTAALFAPQVRVLMAGRRCVVAEIGRFPDLRTEAFAILTEAPPQFALAGLGFGALLALEIMRQAPARVTRLALIAARVSLDTPEERDERERLVALVRDGRTDEAHAEIWPRLTHASLQDDAALEETVMRMAEETGPGRFAMQQAALLCRTHYQTVLSGIRVPALVLVGDSDEITPRRTAAHIASIIPGAELAAIRDCGHLPTIERPALTTAALQRWLARES